MKQIILPSKEYANAPDNDLNIKLELSNETNLIREGDRNIILDLSEQYKTERNSCNNYKIYGKLKMVFHNAYSGTTDYLPLKNKLYLNGDGTNDDWSGYLPYNEFSFVRNDFLREVYQINNKLDIGTTKVINKSDHINITQKEASSYNWNMFLSYCYDTDEEYEMTYTYKNNSFIKFKAKDGIPFIVYEYSNYYKLVSPISHNINAGEFIVLSGTNLTNTVEDNIFLINAVGDENYNSEKNTLIIYKSQFKSSLGEIVLGKRCIDKNNITNTLSKYYVQKLKILTNYDDVSLEDIKLETSVWDDQKKILFKNFNNDENIVVEKNRSEVLLFDFKNSFTLNNLKNNLGYLPTEIYITIINKNSNGYFDYPLKSGFDFNFHDTWIDKHFESDNSNEINLKYNDFSNSGINFKTGISLKKDDVIYGNFVEYNDYNLQETIISNIKHKLILKNKIFNYGQNDSTIFSGSSDNNLFGYFYQPHYKIKLRELSPYVEYYLNNIIYDLPDNAKFDDILNRWKWRDLYDHGFIDDNGYGTDYPYFNNMHYIKKDINFYLKNEVNFTNIIQNKNNFNNIKITC
jgi:hypothetical protein